MLPKILYLLTVLSVVLSYIKCDLKIPQVNPSETQYHKFNMVRDVRPIRYYIDISLDPIPNFQYYNGSSRIEFRSNFVSNFFAFHLKLIDLIDIHDISLMSLDSAAKKELLNVTYFEDGNDPLIGIETKDELEQGLLYSLNINYTVRFKDGERDGFFKFCYYLNSDDDNCFATTNFEVYNIRSAFPSFDNASLKAHFNIRIQHRRDMMAKSNMPERIIDQNDATVVTVFDESPPMSTYLVAIAIGKFESTPIPNTYSNLTMNFYAPIGVGKSTLLEKYAGQFVYVLEQYLDKPFPLPKLDYFASYTAIDTIQGMEHWGLISFDGDSILDTDNLENFEDTDNTIKVIAHEIVHQYFGNLVSLKELNHMWLKEGITTYFTSRVSDQVFPDEHYMERMFLIDYAFAMEFNTLYDSVMTLNNYEALHQDFHNSLLEIHVIYTKGSAITNMICHVLGENSFKTFIQNLVNNFEYDSISTDDFINELLYVNDMDLRIPENIDISAFVNSWLNQPKFPILTVIRHYATDVIEVTQTSILNNTFWIPFNYAIKSNPNFDVTIPDDWLRNVPSTNITVPNLKPTDWIMFNKQATGYYVVNYDARNWKLIVELLSTDSGFDTIPPLNRAKLIMDATILYRQSLLPDDILFKVINLLGREHSLITWTIVENFVLNVPDIKLYMEENVNELIAHFYAYYGLVHQPNETRITKLARTKAIELACKLKYSNCLEDMENAVSKIAKDDVIFDNIGIDWPMFKILFSYGVKKDDQFKGFFRNMNRSKNKAIKMFFYDNLEEKVNINAFRTIFITTVYNLPSSNNDEDDLRFNLDLIEMELFYDLTILDDCLLANCYDFVKVFPNATERFERIYKVVEMVLNNMEQPKNRYVDDDRRFATAYDVLGNIERLYGRDISIRIKANYDLDKPQQWLG